MKDEIVLYQFDKLSTHLEVRVENETVWLNRQQIALLFDRDIKTIGKHINNVFAEGELEEKTTVAKFATVQNEGGRMVERQVENSSNFKQWRIILSARTATTSASQFYNFKKWKNKQ